ncbi:Xanthine phosphoribosyltransferase 1 [Linnemannia zychae]|nr:Xanthine phosphoribosyltransferase 1 [Linnemannia zychae]
MCLTKWYSRRVWILIIVAIIVAQWAFPRHTSPLLYLSSRTEVIPSDPTTLNKDQQGQRRLQLLASRTHLYLSRIKEHAVNNILYANDAIGGTVETESIVDSEEDWNIDGIDVEDKEPEIDITPRAARVQGGELDDGEEDPNYYDEDPVHPRDMPFWFLDWLVNKTSDPSTLWPETINDFEIKTVSRHGFAPNAIGSSSSNRPRRPAIFDIVYTWVNGSDPEWEYSKHYYMQQDPTLRKTDASNITEKKAANRFRDNNELLYSVRSTYMFGGDIIRKVHIATADVTEETLWKSMSSENAGGTMSRGMSAMDQSSDHKEPKIDSSRVNTGSSGNGDSIATSAQERATTHQDHAKFSFDAVPLDALKATDEAARKKEATDAQAVQMKEHRFFAVEQDATLRPFVPKPLEANQEAGQIPLWLDRSAATREKVDVVHHSTFFRNKNNLPVFNSAAIESQLHRIPGLSDVFLYMNDDIYFGMPMAQSDYWTPHYGLVFQMTLHSLVRPIPVVDGKRSIHDQGYDENLRFANQQLSKRFGYRFRPQIAHSVHVASRSILEEAEALWPEAFIQSESARFRFHYDGNSLETMFLMTHLTIERLRETQLRSFWRYRVDYNGNGVLEWEERWALVALIMDWTRSGNSVNHERNANTVNSASRFLHGYDEVLCKMGYREPKQAPAVRYAFSGMEGFPFLLQHADTSASVAFDPFRPGLHDKLPLRPYGSFGPADRVCHFNLEFCLGSKFLTRNGNLRHEDTEKIFNRLAFKEFHCGDCLLQIILHSDRGVDYYNERVELSEDDGWGDRVPFRTPPTSPRYSRKKKKQQHHHSPSVSYDKVDLGKHVSLHELYNNTRVYYTQHQSGISAILPRETTHPKARTRVMQDLYRYNYVVGESNSYFGMITTLEPSSGHFEKLRERRLKNLTQAVCLNDDVAEDDKDAPAMWGMLSEFQEGWFGEPSPWEKR